MNMNIVPSLIVIDDFLPYPNIIRNWALTQNFYSDKDIHIHIPAGAIPKDGPSAGVTMATSLVSLFTNKMVRKDVAMTGEITLRGRVLPVGGLKEKVLAAKRVGIHNIVIPAKNKNDVQEIPKPVRQNMHFIFADRIYFRYINSFGSELITQMNKGFIFFHVLIKG